MESIVGRYTILLLIAVLSTPPNAVSPEKHAINNSGTKTQTDRFVVEAESATASSVDFAASDDAPKHLVVSSAGWLAYDVEVATAGRYCVQIHAQTEKEATTSFSTTPKRTLTTPELKTAVLSSKPEKMTPAKNGLRHA